MARFTLYGIWASGPAYKVGLMLNLIGEPFDYVHVDLMSGAQREPGFLADNPFGVVPTLVDHQTGIAHRQSAVIVESLAEMSGKFLGADAHARRHSREFVMWGWDRFARSLYRTRAVRIGFFKATDDVVAHYTDEAKSTLKTLNGFLDNKMFLTGDQPTFADIDLYGVAAYAGQAGFNLDEYPNIRAWASRIEALPGFIGIAELLPKQDRKAS